MIANHSGRGAEYRVAVAIPQNEKYVNITTLGDFYPQWFKEAESANRQCSSVDDVNGPASRVGRGIACGEIITGSVDSNNDSIVLPVRVGFCREGDGSEPRCADIDGGLA